MLTQLPKCVPVCVCVHLVEALLVKLGVLQRLADVCLVVKGLIKRLQASRRHTAVLVMSGLIYNRATPNLVLLLQVLTCTQE